MTRMTTGAVTLLAAFATAGVTNAQPPPLPERANEALVFQNDGAIDEAITAWTDVATGIEQIVLQGAALQAPVPRDAQRLAAEAWFSVGFLGREEPTQSIAAYTRAVLLDPAMAKAYYNRGNMKFLQARYREALEDYQISADLEEDAHTHYNLGNARLVTGDCRGAVETYRHAEGLSGADTPPYMSRNRIYAMIACGDLEQAANELDKSTVPNKAKDLQALKDISDLIGDSDVSTSYRHDPSMGFVVTVRAAADQERKTYKMVGTAGNAGSTGSTAARSARGGEGIAFSVEVTPAGR